MAINIDTVRRFYLSLAEATDAWRIVPRVLVSGYGYLLYKVVTWYMDLKPYMLDGCVSDTVTQCIVQAPTTQHAALVTAVVGIAAAFFGLYTNTGQQWDRYVFRRWKTDSEYYPELPDDGRTDQGQSGSSSFSQYSKRQDGLKIKPQKAGSVGAPPPPVGTVGAPPVPKPSGSVRPTSD